MIAVKPALLWAMASPSGEAQPGGLLLFLPWILIFVVFYFLLIAPARKRQKKHAEMLNQLKNGDRVITNGGIYGTVVGVAEEVVQLRIADQIKVDVAKNAIAGLQEPSS